MSSVASRVPVPGPAQCLKPTDILIKYNPETYPLHRSVADLVKPHAELVVDGPTNRVLTNGFLAVHQAEEVRLLLHIGVDFFAPTG